MNTRCAVCSSLLKNGFCSTCDQNQLEKTRLHEFGFTQATMPRLSGQSNTESSKTGRKGSSVTQILQSPVKRPLLPLKFLVIEDASANSDNYEPDF